MPPAQQLACLARRCVSMPCAWSHFRSLRSSFPHPSPLNHSPPHLRAIAQGTYNPLTGGTSISACLSCAVVRLHALRVVSLSLRRPFAPRAAACPTLFPLNHSPPHPRAITQGKYNPSTGSNSSTACISCAAVRHTPYRRHPTPPHPPSSAFSRYLTFAGQVQRKLGKWASLFVFILCCWHLPT